MSGLGKRIMNQAMEKGLTTGDGGEDPITQDKTKKVLKVDRSKIDPDELITVKEFINERKSLGDWKHAKQSTGMVAASVTSSAMNVQQVDKLRDLNEAEMMTEIWNTVKSHQIKTYIQIITNMGTLSVILYSHQAARTSFSFLERVYKNEFNGMKFQKMVEGTIIQLNNPKSRTMSLANIDKSEKLKHDRGGLLTIETTGELSSFGITLAASAQLDSRFTVFGRIAGGFKIIKNVAELGAEDETILRADFQILKIEVISDAFKEGCKKIRRRLLGIDKVKEKQIKEDAEKEKRRQTLSKILMI